MLVNIKKSFSVFLSRRSKRLNADSPATVRHVKTTDQIHGVSVMSPHSAGDGWGFIVKALMWRTDVDMERSAKAGLDAELPLQIFLLLLYFCKFSVSYRVSGLFRLRAASIFFFFSWWMNVLPKPGMFLVAVIRSKCIIVYLLDSSF